MNNKRVKVTIGSIFEVPLKNNLKGYFQFTELDLTQLNSEVIRVFKKKYHSDDQIALSDIVNDEISFYAHVVIKWGLQKGLWNKIGQLPIEVPPMKFFFRDSKDYGYPEIKISKRWYVWESNKDFKYIGELKGKYTNYELGVVVAPHSIVNRIETGKYDFVYPGY